MKKMIFLSLIIAIAAAFFASTHPDGLDKVSELFGFSQQAQGHPALMAGYSLPFTKPGPLSTAFSGITGILIVSGLFVGIKKLFSR